MSATKRMFFALALLAGLPAAAAALSLSGSVTETGADVEAPFVFDIAEGTAPEPGPLTLQFLDTAGAELHAVPFGTATIYACGGGPCREIRTHFSLLVTLPADVSAHMATLRILRGDRVLAEIRSTAHRPSATREARAVAPVPPGREPGAVVTAPGRVRLTWDAAAHPRIMVRNATGDVIGFGASGEMELITDSPRLELLMSDGLRSLSCPVEVRPAPAPAPTACG